MMTPQDLGLPAKIKSWRPGQYEAIEDIAEVLLKHLLKPGHDADLDDLAVGKHDRAGGAFYLLDASCGAGKSIIGIAATRRILQGLNAFSRITIDQSESIHCIYLCLTKNNLIRTFDGVKSINQVGIGDSVITRRGDYRRVIQIGKKSYCGEVIRIHVAHTEPWPLEVTPEHKILVVKGTRKENRDYSKEVWTRAESVTKGWRLIYPLRKSTNSFVIDIAYLIVLAWYITEGSIGAHGYQISFHLGADEKSEAGEIIENLKHLSVNKCSSKKVGSNLRINIGDIKLAQRLIIDAGKGAKNKTFPEWIFDLSQNEREVFLSKLVKGDGCVVQDHFSSFCTTSFVLAEKIRDLVLSVNHFPTMSHVKKHMYHIEGRRGECLDLYLVRWNNEPDGANRGHYRGELNNTIAYEMVTMVERVHYNDFVYDLTIDGEDNFCTSIGIVHNCKTKQLQDQILTEFPEARTVKGRTNYPCGLVPNKFPKVTAEDCIEGCPLKKPENQINCPYFHAKNLALAASIAVLNQSYFLAEANGPGQFSTNTMLIVDEIDTLEGELMGHIQLTVTQKTLDQLKHYPENYDELASWREWAVSAPIDRLVERSERQMPLLFDPRSGKSLGDMTDSQIEIHKGIIRLRALQRKLNRFAMEVNDNWVFYEEKNDKGETSWIFKPVFVSDYAFDYCWRHTRSVLGMSGTILDHKLMADSLGISLETVKYHRIPSLFLPERRLIYYQGIANLTRDTLNSELPKIAEAVDSILQKHAEDKVLVHTTSYQIRDYLIANLTSSGLITHGSENRAEKLEEFKKSTTSLVMLSPSFDRGVDLPNDQCRVIIVCKVPYPNLADLQIKKRMEAPGGNLWYLTTAVRTIIQMTGRGMRHENDFCESYILDTQFRRLFGRVRHLFPDWWQKALRW